MKYTYDFKTPADRKPLDTWWSVFCNLWHDYKTEIMVVGGILAVLAVVIYAYSVEQSEWQKFKAAHNCVVVGKQQASVGISSDGKTVTIPARTGYKCDDGITYWRDE